MPGKFFIRVWVYQWDGSPGDTPHLYEREYARDASDLNLALIRVAERCQKVARAIAKIEIERIGE